MDEPDPKLAYSRNAKYRRFWHTRSSWPVEPKVAHADSFVFLANVVCQVGERLFPDDWTNEDPWHVVRPALPEAVPDHGGGSLTRAYYLLGKDLEELAITVPEKIAPLWKRKHAGEEYRVTKALTAKDWAKARALSVSVEASDQAAFDRWLEAVETTTRLFRDGNLPTFSRLITGGDIDPERRVSDWYSEVVGSRFAFCQIDITDRFSGREGHPGGPARTAYVNGHLFSYIYTTAAALAPALDLIGIGTLTPEVAVEKMRADILASIDPVTKRQGLKLRTAAKPYAEKLPGPAKAASKERDLVRKYEDKFGKEHTGTHFPG